MVFVRRFCTVAACFAIGCQGYSGRTFPDEHNAQEPEIPTAEVSATEAEWPQFRGPHRDDVSADTGLLKKWPKAGPPVLWKGTGVGSGYSSVVVSGGKVYTMGNKGSLSSLFALDSKNGRLLWSAKVGKAGNSLGCTPTVDEDRVYAIGQEGDLVCVDAKTGNVRWHKNFQQDFGGHCGGWQYTESPLVDGNKLVCTPGAADATIVALDKMTGAVLWKCAAPLADATAGYSSIVIAEVGGIREYVQLLAGGVVGVAAKDGRFLWKYDKLGNNTANIPTPIVLGDKVFCSAGYGKGGALLQLVPSGEEVSVNEIYFNRELTNKHGGLVVVGDYVYGDKDDSGYPFCAEVMTGKVVWRKKDRGNGLGSAALTYADGCLYFRYDNGVMALVEASPEGYKELSSFRIPKAANQSWAHPVVAGGRMYLREQDVVWCYDVKQHANGN
jgi:outer membrane protein assembly factor BamB